MSRENIFDKMNKVQNIAYEIDKIERLLRSKSGVLVRNEYEIDFEVGIYKSIIDYVDGYLFMKWKNRATCICCRDVAQMVGIDQMPSVINYEWILNYCEYAANILYLVKSKARPYDLLGDEVDAALHNICVLLGWYGYKVEYLANDEKALVVRQSAQATAVAEVLPADLAKLVIEYNHFTLRGDKKRKKDILIALGAALEAKRKELNSINKSLADKIFFMLNNLNIRHNNVEKGHKGYNESVAKMKNATLENWYDELYQMILLAYLLMDNQDRNAKVDELICKIGNKEN